MSLRSKHTPKALFITGLFFWLIGIILYNSILNHTFSEQALKKFEQQFKEKEEEVHQITKTLSRQVDDSIAIAELFKTSSIYSNKYDIDFFIYFKDSLITWTNNHVPVPLKNPEITLSKEVIQLKNGWYYFSKSKHKNYTIYGSFLIKNTYQFQNEDLINSFAPYFKNIINADILPPKKTPYNIYNDEGEAVFSLQPFDTYQPSETIEIIVFFCFLIGFYLWLQLLISSTQVILLKKPYLLILYPISLLLLRYLSIKLNWLSVFSNFKLFNPELYASSEIVPSLGDLIINVSIFYFLIHFLLKRTRDWFKKGNQKLKLVLYIIPFFVISFYVAYAINEIIYSLVYDSNINFNLELLFDLDIYSFISIIIIGTCFYTYFKFVQFIVKQFKKNEFELNKLAFLWALLSLIYILLDVIKFQNSLLTTLWPILFSGFIVWFEYKEKTYKFVHVISIVAFVAFYSAYILDDYTSKKEKELRQLYAEEIATDEDPITEIDYDNIEKTIEKDKFLVSVLARKINLDRLYDTLENQYFKKLKSKYDLNFHLFDSTKNRIVNYSFIGSISYNDLHQIITHSGKPSSINPNIYYIKNYAEKLSYLVEYPIKNKDTLLGYMFVELRSKKFPQDIGLPSLLLEKDNNYLKKLKPYSVAKYVDHYLVSRKGKFEYPFVPAEWFYVDPKRLTRDFVSYEGYNHYIYQLDPNQFTLISKKESSFLTLFTSFSYLLIIYGLLILFPLSYQQLTRKQFSFKNIPFNIKIQVVIVGLLLASLIAFGIGAGTYVVKQYHINSKDFIKEKTGSVQTELTHKLGGEKELKSDLIYLEYLLKKFSRVFVTDINMYDYNGDLLASSQPKIYSFGLVSEKMNPEAFQQININKKSEFIHQENIGRLPYLSAYVPFINEEGKLLAYLNLQYISKQDDLENQISGFLLAIINIMVLMLAISVILAIALSNRLTYPLKYIQESLKNMQLGSKNKAIVYEGNDEIGDLVNEYNKKVLELQKSVEQLAKSERESAWREMAKQVAHEIKNPLTPMKLSIQHMKRSIEVKNEDSKEKMERVSASLIEQIDALTKIANEFSNFAKMPKAKDEKINLTEILKNTAAVFANSGDHQIEFVNNVKHQAEIWADKTLLIRVFNNLIKNAIQSIPASQEGLIKVILREKDEKYIVEIKDNGTGISEEASEKIFVPYFTTKTTGTGLGLAMTKQIIENLGGSIYFDSKLNKGTSFFVSFPKFN